jgi:RHS repeat-associated protein
VGGLLAAVFSGDPELVEGYYAFDGNGNVSELVGTNGTTLAHYEYDPFGNLTIETGSMAASNPFRFSTKYWDVDSKLAYYGYRYYSPGVGRWVSRDPMGEEGGFNIYSQSENNSLNRFDLFGLWSAIVRDPSQSRAPTCADKGDTIRTLASSVKLDENEAFGENGWLKDSQGYSVSDIKEGQTYTVPNVGVISLGSFVGVSLPSYFIDEMEDMAEDFSMKNWFSLTDDSQKYGIGRGYKIKWVQASTPSDINGALNSKDVAFWAHSGHGINGSLILKDNNTYPASEFKTTHHKMAFVLLYSCFAARGDWWHMVSKDGSVYASKYVIGGRENDWPGIREELISKRYYWYQLPAVTRPKQ